jgi:hypothetical protein
MRPWTDFAMKGTELNLFDSTRKWAERALERGWLGRAQGEALARIERARPGDLFEPAARRPLVIGLFGGTGVGKSSLLNRLAESAIARTGVQRPTSHEVTVYAHEDTRLAELPPGLPVDRVAIRRHGNDRHRGVMWIDMPDFDSTAQENRALALAWLPHIDLVIYVVSPERYRDDVGWRILRERGGRHGWLFVMNHWDEAGETQVEDLRAILSGAGFDDPVVLRTCAAGPAATQAADDFEGLLDGIDELLAAHGLEGLERAADHARRSDLARWLGAASAAFGEPPAWAALTGEIRAGWQRARAALREGMTWPISELSGRIALHSAERHAAPTWLRLRLRRRAPDPTPPGALDSAGIRQLASGLWDEWALSKLRDLVDGAELAAYRHATARAPLRRTLEAVAADAGQVLTGAMAEGLQRALARPGSIVQRALRAALGLLAGVLPSAALAWVGYHVVTTFLAGVSGDGPFLGLGFAVHAALLVAVAWLLPYLLFRLLRPDPQRSAAAGLRAGLDTGLDALDARLDAALAALESERAVLRAEAARLRNARAGEPAAPSPDTRVRRVLRRTEAGDAQW